VTLGGQRLARIIKSSERGSDFVCVLSVGEPPLLSSGPSSWLQDGDVLFLVRHELNLYVYVI
jgi:hypothetical protein